MATPIDHVNALYRPFLNQGRPGKFHFTRFMHGYIEFNRVLRLNDMCGRFYPA